ncbi:hypothetical protein MPLSOD_80144 [Mesorhizobium sp. SOD10]|nr:hypothetical protein MPLSOD_80144 [Mesorhizobium sp. SOD10]
MVFDHRNGSQKIGNDAYMIDRMDYPVDFFGPTEIRSCASLRQSVRQPPDRSLTLAFMDPTCRSTPSASRSAPIICPTKTRR